MSIKIFNYTNDRYSQNIYGEDTRSKVSAIIGNDGYAFMGTIEQEGNFTTYLVKKGSIIFSGGLCIRVLEDEKIDMTNNNYIVLETSYDPATKNCPCYGEVKDASYNPSTESYTCKIKGVEIAEDEIIQGDIKKHFIIYDKNENKTASGLSADSIGNITAEELDDILNNINDTLNDLKDTDIEYGVKIQNVKTQTNELKEELDAFKESSAKAIPFDFDNLAAYKDVIRTTTFGDTIKETIKKNINGKQIANRETIFNENGTIETNEKVYEDNGTTLKRNVKIVTVFSDIGEATEITETLL